MAVENLVVKAVGLGVTLLVVRFVYAYLTHPLKHIPGPFWAQFTNWWRMLDYWNCTQIQTHQTLHKELGPAVRIGPNLVSLSDPELIKQVYSTRGDYVKVRNLSLWCCVGVDAFDR